MHDVYRYIVTNLVKSLSLTVEEAATIIKRYQGSILHYQDQTVEIIGQQIIKDNHKTLKLAFDLDNNLLLTEEYNKIYGHGEAERL